MELFTSSYLVRYEHLNQYQTLFVGTVMGWIDEVGFITATKTLNLEEGSLVCFAANDVVYGQTIPNGSILSFKAKVVKLGETSVTVYVEGSIGDGNKKCVSAFMTYVYLDPDTRNKTPHGKVLDETQNPRELELRRLAENIGN